MTATSADDTPEDKHAEEPARAPDDRIGTVLKATRERHGLSVREVHEKTGISPAVLYGYEAGKTKPGAREIKLLCEALKITPNALLFGTEDPFGLPAEDAASRLARMAETPGLDAMIWLFMAPMAMAVLDNEQKRAVFSVVLSMVQAKEPDVARKVARAVEAFDVAMLEKGYGWGDLAKLSKAERDGFLAHIQARIGEAWKD